jgi:hypothetical protein
MFKVGFKASYFGTMDKIGTVVKIDYLKNNQMTVGGTTDTRVYITLKYSDNSEVTYKSGDLIRHFD